MNAEPTANLESSLSICDGFGLATRAIANTIADGAEDSGLKTIHDCLARWNGLLGTTVNCDFKQIQTPVENPRECSRSVPGIRDGTIFFTREFLHLAFMAPNVVIGHECGHELERTINNAGRGTTAGLKEQQAFVTPGFTDLSRRHSCPPFGVISHHHNALLQLFPTTELQALIGYNARQIYADSVPIKETLLRIAAGQNDYSLMLEHLLTEWTKILHLQCDLLTPGTRAAQSKIPAVHIPAAARFVAIAQVLTKVAHAWVSDQLQANRLLAEFESLAARFSNLLKQQIPAGSKHAGLTDEQSTAVAILATAYKQHFANCISRKELLKEEDLRPHLEKLNSTDETTRLREAYTLGETDDQNLLPHLSNRLQIESAPYVALFLLGAIGDLIALNPHEELGRRHLKMLLAYSPKDFDTVLGSSAAIKQISQSLLVPRDGLATASFKLSMTLVKKSRVRDDVRGDLYLHAAATARAAGTDAEYALIRHIGWFLIKLVLFESIGHKLGIPPEERNSHPSRLSNTLSGMAAALGEAGCRVPFPALSPLTTLCKFGVHDIREYAIMALGSILEGVHPAYLVNARDRKDYCQLVEKTLNALESLDPYYGVTAEHLADLRRTHAQTLKRVPLPAP